MIGRQRLWWCTAEVSCKVVISSTLKKKSLVLSRESLTRFNLMHFFMKNFFSHIFRSISCRNCGGPWARTTIPPSHVASKDVQQRDIHEVSGDVIPINMVKGIGHLRDPRLNKVLSFSSLSWFKSLSEFNLNVFFCYNNRAWRSR